MYSSILNITFDCADAKAQATFWAAVTGWVAHVQDDTPGHVEYSVEPPRPDGSSSLDGPRLYFTTVAERKQLKNRIHLDLIPPDWDQQAELARLTGLGATAAGGQPSDAAWIILADPEGNEFCLEG